MFNKVNKTVYTTIDNYIQLDDKSIQVKYVIGVCDDDTKLDTSFVKLAEEYKYIQADVAIELSNRPLTAEDIGKTPGDIILARIYEYLKDTDQIIV